MSKAEMSYDSAESGESYDSDNSESQDSFDSTASASSTASTSSTASAEPSSPSMLTTRFSPFVAELVAHRMPDHKWDSYPMKHIACIFSGNPGNPLKVVYGCQLVTSGAIRMQVQSTCGDGCYQTAAA